MTVTARELNESIKRLPSYHEFPGEYYRIMLLPRGDTRFSHANSMVIEKSEDRIIEFKKQNGEWVLHSLPRD